MEAATFQDTIFPPLKIYAIARESVPASVDQTTAQSKAVSVGIDSKESTVLVHRNLYGHPLTGLL